MSDKVEVAQYEEAPVKLGKRRGCTRHLKKFWWAYLVGLVCITVLVVPLILLVAIPKLAQSKINSAKFHIDGITITKTRTKTMTVALNASMGVTGTAGLKATIAKFPAELYLADLEPYTTFLTLDFPKTSASSHINLNITQDIEIQNMEAFTTFAAWLLGKETLNLGMRGKTSIRVRGISRNYGISFKKSIELKGVNQFKGLDVTDTSISLQPDEKGDNFHGWVNIPNPSILEVEIGTLSFIPFVDGVNLGTASVDGLTLYPGINNVSMRANISQVPVLAAVTKKPTCKTGLLPFQLQVKSAVNDGENLPYFTNALAGANLTVDIDIGETLEKDLNMTLSCS
ncbi:hypothetical protein BGZ61DRAFT_565787 [Ilyonectria robusta]|uniref:uncharacterized protein n=1 Tax=Ilyonectria robusta TaxID=1079257 RepID=UPI001E8EADBC|nr:uncharacterized protein BGZ61DRAFT_565787 [Ilyonectria robusta]KAH8733707.1 hypothetical protein BGZ61DRAFT_565787 [Ilyonectria robusta]